MGPRRALVLAWLISSLAFGTAHATNPNATMLSTFNIVLAGLMLSLPYLLTGQLAISIGLHATWNLFQGNVFGFPVSGSAPRRRLLNLDQGGPELWTGGAFGPEGGLLAVVWMLIGCGLIVLWLKRRRQHLGLQMSLAQYQPAAHQAAGQSSDVAGGPPTYEGAPFGTQRHLPLGEIGREEPPPAVD
jgi:hypothetical protein